MATDQTLAERRSALSKDLLRRVPRLLTTSPLPFRNSKGRSPVLVVLPEDKCSDVIGWASETDGANVLTVHNKHLLVVSVDPKQAPAEGDGSDASQAIHPDAEFGMLLDLLDQNPESAVQIDISRGHIAVPQPRELQAA